MQKINFNCCHFLGDRPCKPHKDKGVNCDKCKFYEPVSKRILIIKLGAMGDVLRTTCILPRLKEKFPRSQITWITKSESIPLLLNNHYIDRVFDLLEAGFVLKTDKFDLVINLDASQLSSRLATIAKSNEKLGYAYNEKGYVYPLNSEAIEWFQIGISDDLKKQNKKTYQQIMMEICKLPLNQDSELILNLTEEEKQFAMDFAQKHQLTGGPIIGFNTGAGRRWEHKKWTTDGFLKLAELLTNDGYKVVLYGGPEEEERNKYLKKMLPQLIDTGCKNTIRQFASLINLCTILVTGDTLTMHIAIALKKKVVVLFGPTSYTEIEIYGRGEKVISSLPCVCCYKNFCSLKPNCMEAIIPRQVYEVVRRCLE